MERPDWFVRALACENEAIRLEADGRLIAALGPREDSLMFLAMAVEAEPVRPKTVPMIDPFKLDEVM